MIKLQSITFENAPKLPGLRPGEMTTLKLEEPNDNLVGWRAILRGSVLFLVSPAGYKIGGKASERDASGPCTIHEVPRSNCYFTWVGAVDDLAGMLKGFESPPFGRPTPVVHVSPEDGGATAITPVGPQGLLGAIGA